MHFHGTSVRKPIPSYQIYQRTAFELVDQAVDFVLSKINRHIGTRAESVQAPATYELPKEAVTEAIVNAVAFVKVHARITNKDYRDLTGTTIRTASRDLEELVTKGVLQKIGVTGWSTHYVLAGKQDIGFSAEMPVTSRQDRYSRRRTHDRWSYVKYGYILWESGRFISP